MVAGLMVVPSLKSTQLAVLRGVATASSFLLIGLSARIIPEISREK